MRKSALSDRSTFKKKRIIIAALLDCLLYSHTGNCSVTYKCQELDLKLSILGSGRSVAVALWSSESGQLWLLIKIRLIWQRSRWSMLCWTPGYQSQNAPDAQASSGISMLNWPMANMCTLHVFSTKKHGTPSAHYTTSVLGKKHSPSLSGRPRDTRWFEKWISIVCNLNNMVIY